MKIKVSKIRWYVCVCLITFRVGVKKKMFVRYMRFFMSLFFLDPPLILYQVIVFQMAFCKMFEYKIYRVYAKVSFNYIFDCFFFNDHLFLNSMHTVHLCNLFLLMKENDISNCHHVFMLFLHRNYG